MKVVGSVESQLRIIHSSTRSFTCDFVARALEKQ